MTEKLMNIKFHKKLILLSITSIIGMMLTGCASQSTSSFETILWPKPPQTARIELIEILKPSDFEQRSFSKIIKEIVFGKSPVTSMNQAFGVAADSNNVYLVDSGSGSIVIFNRITNEIRSIGQKANLIFPVDVILIDTLLYVTDSRGGKIYCLDKAGNLVKELGKDDNLSTPGGLAYHSDLNKLYVTDSQNHRIVVYDLEASKMDTVLGMRGIGDGEFNFPSNITIKNDKLYVVDTFNFRIQILTPTGEFISAFGKAGDAPGDLYRPKGIGVSSDGLIFVSDSYYNNFQIFDEEGQLYLFVGRFGNAPGEFNEPKDMFMDPNDNLFVVDQKNSRIQVFKYLKYQ